MPDIKIKKIGHACVQFFYNGDSILFDPWFGGSVNYDIFCSYPEMVPPTPEEIRSVKAVYISHIHDDHLQKESLMRLSREIPIYIFKSKNRQFYDRILSFGFENIIEVNPGEKKVINENFSITIFPKLPENGSFDSSAVLEIAHRKFYLSNDCLHPDIVYTMISKMFSEIDGAFVGYTAITAADACVDYSECLDFANQNENPNERSLNAKAVWSHIQRMVEILGPKWVSPYAADYRFRHEELLQFNDLFSEAEDIYNYPAIKSKRIVLSSGDYLHNETGEVVRSESLKSLKISPLPPWIDLNCPPFNFEETLMAAETFFLRVFSKRAAFWITPMRIELVFYDKLNRKSIFYVFDGKEVFVDELNRSPADLVVEYNAQVVSELVKGRWTLNAFHRLFLHKVKWRRLKYGQMSLMSW